MFFLSVEMEKLMDRSAQILQGKRMIVSAYVSQSAEERPTSSEVGQLMKLEDDELTMFLEPWSYEDADPGLGQRSQKKR